MSGLERLPIQVTQGVSAAIVNAIGWILNGAGLSLKGFAVAYSASMTPDLENGSAITINPTNNVAFTINAPVFNGAAIAGVATLPNGSIISITIRNASGGALGVATFNAVFKLSAWTQPANGNSRTISFRWDGTNWVEMNRTTADIPN